MSEETQAYETETLLAQLAEIIDAARPMPLSASVLINREEVIELISDAVAGLPEELRQARWLLKEREEFLIKARREAEEIVEAGRLRAERMVERTEVVREARRKSQEVVDEAAAQARDIKHEAEDYVDQKLAKFQVVLERTMAAVENGRERLRAVLPEDGGLGDAEEDDETRAGEFFNQDEM